MMPLATHYFNFESVYDDSNTDYLYSRCSMATRSIASGLSSVVPIPNGPPMNYAFGESETTLSTVGVVLRPPPTTTPPNANLTVPPGFGLRARSNSTLRAIVRDPIPAGGGPNGTQDIHKAIRYRLSIPRGKLYIFWGTGMEGGSPPAGELTPPSTQLARLFLESPTPEQRCDCKNGPFPRLLGISQAYGDAQTLEVDWAVETFVNEAALNNVRTPGALLSNRFAQTHEVLEDGYTVITTEGVAIYRTDSVYSNPHSPDEDRPFLFMPIPQGFTRHILYVRGRDDVTGVEYAFQDKQQSVNFVAGPFVKAASISAVHRQAVSSSIDFSGSALNAYERILGIRANRNIAKSDPDHPAKNLRRKVNAALTEFDKSKKP